ncbi:hypothetical protein B0H14DRAFT_1465883 [Mycena olivaceomarginata]|nr:hypothetical protein B0H14DRAFT_1465883 [Mycena olivaceomarginata]
MSMCSTCFGYPRTFGFGRKIRYPTLALNIVSFPSRPFCVRYSPGSGLHIPTRYAHVGTEQLRACLSVLAKAELTAPASLAVLTRSMVMKFPWIIFPPRSECAEHSLRRVFSNFEMRRTQLDPAVIDEPYGTNSPQLFSFHSPWRLFVQISIMAVSFNK